MIDLTTPIIPYVGTGIFKLDASYDEVKTLLAEHNVPYDEGISQPNDIDPPWYIIGISKEGEKDDVISITFAKNRLSGFVSTKVLKVNCRTASISVCPLTRRKELIQHLPTMIGRKFMSLPKVIGLNTMMIRENYVG